MTGNQTDVTNINKFQPVRTSLEILKTYVSLFPGSITPTTGTNIEAGVPDLHRLIYKMEPADIEALWQSNLTEFKQMRSKYLLYHFR